MQCNDTKRNKGKKKNKNQQNACVVCYNLCEIYIYIKIAKEWISRDSFISHCILRNMRFTYAQLVLFRNVFSHSHTFVLFIYKCTDILFFAKWSHTFSLANRAIQMKRCVLFVFPGWRILWSNRNKINFNFSQSNAHAKSSASFHSECHGWFQDIQEPKQCCWYGFSR